MPEARPQFPIYVLDRIVGVIAKPGEEWWEIPCAIKKAYGFGANTQEVVEGLKLYARLGDGPLLTSSLAIGMSVDARRKFESMLGIDPDGPIGSDLRAHAAVDMAEEEGLTTILLSFKRSSLTIWSQRPLNYYLVYDAADRSLSMFEIPRGEPLCTGKPMVPKRTGCSDHELFLLGRQRQVRSSLWVSSLSPSYSTAASSMFKRMDFPNGEIHKPFKVDVAFSLQGKVFWGDLRQGLVYCDLQTKDFGFVNLPCECKLKVDEETGEPLKPIRNTRTLSCARGSIWFVCIHTPSHYSNDVVCIWELPGEQLEGESKEVEWRIFDKLTAKMLWGLSSFKESGLPEAPFQYPIVMADGALCFVLVDQSRFRRNERPLVDHFCRFDMHFKRLLWHGLVHNYTITDSIVMCPSSYFLQMKQSPCNMSFAEDRCDAGLKAMGGDRPDAALKAMAGGGYRPDAALKAMAGLKMKQSPCIMGFAEDHPDAGLKAMAGGGDRPDAALKAMAGGQDSSAAGQQAMARGVREVVRLFETMAGGVLSVSSNSQGAHDERH